MTWTLRRLAALYMAEIARLRLELQRREEEHKRLIASVFASTTSEGQWQADDRYLRRRLDELQQGLALLLAALMESVYADLVRYEEAAFRLGYYTTAWQMDAANVPPLHSFAVELALSQTYVDATLNERLRDIQREFEVRVRRTLVTSQVEGDTLDRALGRITELWGLHGRTSRGLWFRIRVLSETEFWRAANLGADRLMRENAPSLKGKAWLTQGDPRVESRCRALAGVVIPLAARFHDRLGHRYVDGPPLHPLCRCWTIPVRVDGRMRPDFYSYQQWAEVRGVEPSMDGRALLFNGAPV